MSLLPAIVLISGKPYEVGFASGQRLTASISANMALFWGAVEAVGLSRDELMTHTYQDEANLPLHLRDEIRGLAEGSGQPYRELLAYNLYRGGLACDC